MDRLKRDSKSGRGRQIGIRVNDEEHDQIQDAAKANGERVQLWARKALITASGNDPKPPVPAKMGRPTKEG